MTGDFDFQVGKWMRFQGRGGRALVALAMILVFLGCIAGATAVVARPGVTWLLQLVSKLGS
jgi:hypothetical protein